MTKWITYLAFGSLTFAGAIHFVVDVVAQYVRGQRIPGPETTLYYGLNSAYALGQVAFGLLGLVVATRAIELLAHWPAITISLTAGVAWLILSFAFLEYWEPRIAMAVYCVLVIAAAIAVQADAARSMAT